jgi:hypothetical protein
MFSARIHAPNLEEKLSKINHMRSMYKIRRPKNVPARWLYRCSNFMHDFDLNAASISQDSKYESCRSLP